MDLELSDAEADLRDNVRAVLAGICPPSVPRKVFDGGARPVELWDQMVELGWPAMSIPERNGGLGLGFVEVVLVAEELGRVVAPSPFLATATQVVPLAAQLEGAAADELLAAVASEGRTGALAVAEHGRWGPAAVAARADADRGDWVINGAKSTVVDGGTADEVVVVARGDDGLGAFLVDSSEIHWSRRPALDPTLPCWDGHLDRVRVPPRCVLAVPGAPGVDDAVVRALQQSAVAAAAMGVGACRRIFELTVDYAKVREQYGRPIGSFQALKHRMVDMYLAVERATALVYFAALSVAEDTPDRPVAVAAAKAAACDCQALIVQEGLQLHGGIGYTWEHDLHFLLKRAKAAAALFGGAVAHRAELARLTGVAGDRVGVAP